MAQVCLFDQPQGHRHDVPGVRDHGGPDRRGALDRDPHGIAEPRHPVLPLTARIQRVRHRARPDHDLLHGHAGHAPYIYNII